MSGEDHEPPSRSFDVGCGGLIAIFMICTAIVAIADAYFRSAP